MGLTSIQYEFASCRVTRGTETNSEHASTTSPRQAISERDGDVSSTSNRGHVKGVRAVSRFAWFGATSRRQAISGRDSDVNPAANGRHVTSRQFRVRSVSCFEKSPGSEEGRGSHVKATSMFWQK